MGISGKLDITDNEVDCTSTGFNSGAVISFNHGNPTRRSFLFINQMLKGPLWDRICRNGFNSKMLGKTNFIFKTEFDAMVLP